MLTSEHRSADVEFLKGYGSLVLLSKAGPSTRRAAEGTRVSSKQFLDDRLTSCVQLASKKSNHNKPQEAPEGLTY